ncbi:hypothetical protein ASPACDRAFT_1880894 [Aspergillus aculeatus ATCC 16872]|uniref:Glycosyl hydrolase family 13 catalytic domain-containing protein n=1 Tax=Aspergillus aculeatus (strain ATCC 16872 / CBS 172.66 / WB 5094) TaxID=690307 RepID=A0A1L9WUI1_ASPA1|nr:uncharacterized protein ASPACDRAFT_1880894 [Aspergillus aculeatus ATCC 16872]OJJ99557.1 hypothetical protein ASPACDRAFT_1880894 [Aspergillus aculeatus ATCC 16872]
MTSSHYATPKWWKEAVVYQVYPASFKSSKPPSQADGWGDLLYKSPQIDMGYDISDYKEIDPRYGTMADVDLLIEALHKHNMKLMMDLVVTHTSDQHGWFIESARSKHTLEQSWYVWYLREVEAGHLKLPEFDTVMQFWLSRGVSGFRMDVINLISKDPSFPDAPVVDPSCQFQPGKRFYTNGPRFHEFMHGIYEHVLSRYETITVGETAHVSDISEIIKTCHDQARSVSRYVDDSDKFRARGGKLLALLESTLGGTLYLYQGQGIGMQNFSADWNPDARELLQKKARDHARTPMQWSDEPNAGFAASNVTPWMRVNDDFGTVHVKAQMGCESQDLSVWQYWQLALRNRRTFKDVFVYGDYQDVDLDNEQIYTYLRTGAQTKRKWLVVMNWTGENLAWKIPGSLEVDWMAPSSLQRSIAVGDEATIRLQAWEGVMMCCK